MLYCLHYYRSRFFCLFPPPPSPTFTPPSINLQTVVGVHGSRLNVFWLILSPSFIQSPSSPLAPVSLFHGSMFLFLFCSVVHEILYISEITWYLSFINCPISLGIIPSRSIHAVTRGKSFFFFTAVQHSFHWVNKPQLSHALFHWWALRLFPDLGYFFTLSFFLSCLSDSSWTMILLTMLIYHKTYIFS